MKKLLTSAALGVAVLGGATAYVATSVLPASAQTGQAEAPATGGAKDGTRDHRRHPIIREGIKISAETIGIEPKALAAELKAGKSIADVAVEHGKTADDVVNALVAKINARVDEAVANGKITADRGATIKQKAPDRVTKFVNAHRSK